MSGALQEETGVVDYVVHDSRAAVLCRRIRVLSRGVLVEVLAFSGERPARPSCGVGSELLLSASFWEARRPAPVHG